MIQPLLVSAGVMIVSLLLYGVATAFLVRLVVRLIRSGYDGLLFWKNVMVMTVITLITAAMHLSQIALWAVVFLVVGETSTFERAFYASAENYTALGYGMSSCPSGGGYWGLLRRSTVCCCSDYRRPACLPS